MQFPLEEEFGPQLDGALHVLCPLLSRIYCEGAHAFPGVQVPAAPKAAPAALLISIRGEPFERALHLGMVGVSEANESPSHVPSRAQVAPLPAAWGEATVGRCQQPDPQSACLCDSRIRFRQSEIGQDE